MDLPCTLNITRSPMWKLYSIKHGDNKGKFKQLSKLSKYFHKALLWLIKSFSLAYIQLCPQSNETAFKMCVKWGIFRENLHSSDKVLLFIKQCLLYSARKNCFKKMIVLLTRSFHDIETVKSLNDDGFLGLQGC